MSLIIYNVLTFTNNDQNAVLKNHAVAIEGTHIKEIGEEGELKKKYPRLEHLDGGGRLLMPGLINAHMHFYGTFARGLALQKSPKNFHEILQFLWWRLDSALDLQAIYYSALVQVISAVKHGVTTIVDHHASPNAVDGSLDKIEEALNLLGLRGLLCYEVSDRDGAEVRELGLNENARYIKRCQQARQENPDHLFDGMVGLHASFTLGNESLRRAAELSKDSNCGCHIHVLEDKVDASQTRNRFDRGVVARLREFGVLSQKTIAAHCIHVDEAELDLLAETDTIVVHNPQSNMNNAVGRADIFKMREKGILLGIGTDGMSASIWPDARTANLLHKHDSQNSNAGWNEIQQMTLKNNPEILERLSGRKAGRIEAGYLADLILVDYFPPTPMTNDNIWGHFLFGIADAPVDTTIVNGRVIMRDKEISGLDEDGIAAHARECAEAVWKKFGES